MRQIEHEWTDEEKKVRTQECWDYLGYKIRPSRDRVFVRTDPMLRITPSGILIPPMVSQFHYGLPNKHPDAHAMVLSAGAGCLVQSGDHVSFPRLYFAWVARMPDETLIGYIFEKYLHGWYEGPNTDTLANAECTDAHRIMMIGALRLLTRARWLP